MTWEREGKSEALFWYFPMIRRADEATGGAVQEKETFYFPFFILLFPLHSSFVVFLSAYHTRERREEYNVQ